MKFQFRFQKVLEQKQRLEDDARRTYLEARGKTENALAEMKMMYETIDRARAQSQATSVVPMLAEISNFIVGQKVRISRQRAVIRELKEAEEIVHEQLVLASREKKTFEKLKEKDRVAFQENQDRIEKNELDDLAVMRFGRGEGP